MKLLPSRLKIALLSTAISAAVLIAFGGVIGFLVYDLRIQAADREIRSLASRHPGLFAGRGSHERLASSLEFTFGTDHTNRIIVLLQDAGGRTLYTSPHWPEDLTPEKLRVRPDSDARIEPSIGVSPHAATVPRQPTDGVPARGAGRGLGLGRGGPPPAVVFTRIPRFFTARVADSTWRVGVLGNDDVTLVIGLNHNQVRGELNHARDAFLLALPVALFLVGWGGWVVSGRALRPLKTIADTAERVTARGLNQRIPEPSESPEAARVILVLNRMMDRLEASFLQATRFSADASHELKTPLAVMQGELENALQSAAPGSPEQQLFGHLLEETQRLKTVTRSLLLLAQADAGQLPLALEPVDLSAELETLIEDARVLAAESGLALDLQVQPHVRVDADRALLRTTTFNLLINAIKYNEPDGKISLTLSEAGTQVVFTVGNTGPGIPPEAQPQVFDRFYRVDRADRPGADGIGLGLSLAREIVLAHGGELMLRESRAGWTCFEMRLPRRVPGLPG